MQNMISVILTLPDNISFTFIKCSWKLYHICHKIDIDIQVLKYQILSKSDGNP